jgi:hypothetical protein
MKLACLFNKNLDHSSLLGRDPASDDSSKRIAARLGAGLRTFDPDDHSPIAHPNHVKNVKGADGIRHLILERSPLSDQGGIGSCTANRRADGLELVQPPARVTQISRLALYWPSRREHHDECHDTGSYSSVTAVVSEELGVCRETLWPYDDTPPKEDGGRDDAPMLLRPPLSAYLDMHDHKVAHGSIQAVRRSGKARVQQMLDALDLGFPCGIDAEIGQDFVDGPGKDVIVKAPSISVGGHAILVVGYWMKSDGTVAFRVRNSWGSSWSDDGHCWIAGDYVADSNLVQDVDVTTSSPVWD